MYRNLLLVVPLILFAFPSQAEDDSPEVKALISKFQDDVKSKTSATRISAYKAMGELGSKATNARRLIVTGILDPNPKVGAAASDSLKKVDEKIYTLAMAIYINKDPQKIKEVGTLAKGGEPLTPLILNHAKNAAPIASQFLAVEGKPVGPEPPGKIQEARRHLEVSVETLVSIAPEDLDVNKVVVNMLTNQIPHLRAVALDQVASLKNKKMALSNVLAIAASNDKAATRVKAIQLVPSLTDENTSPVALKALESLRFDGQPTVREAVEQCLKKNKP